MKPQAIIGIDPGSATGCICIIHQDGIDFFDIADNPHDIADFMRRSAEKYELRGVIEKVNVMPKQGAVSGFNFGVGFGGLLMALRLLKIRFEMVQPKEWQKTIDVIPSKDPIPERLKKPFGDATKEKERKKEMARLNAQRKKQVKTTIYDYCRRKHPEIEWRGFNKDSNRADALCIAEYAKTLSF